MNNAPTPATAAPDDLCARAIELLKSEGCSLEAHFRALDLLKNYPAESAAILLSAKTAARQIALQWAIATGNGRGVA